MLNFFRINDPYRLIFILFIALIMRLPFLLGWLDESIPEMKWTLIAAKMSEGSVLYRDIWDNIAPFSALTYWLIYEVFGDSYKVYQVLSLFLVVWQAYLINRILQINKAYNELTYIPALIYVIILHLMPDLYWLSPLLMANTFIILAIHNLFRRIEFKSRDENILNAGLFIGIASLFYLPIALIFLYILFSYVFFTGMVIRRYLLSIYGFLLPFALVWMYFFWFEAGSFFYRFYFLSWFIVSPTTYINLLTLLILVSPVILNLLFSIFFLGSAGGFSNYQTRLQGSMYLLLVFSVIIFLAAKLRMANQLVIFVVPVTFFIGHYYVGLRKGFLRELRFLIFLALVMFVNFSTAGSSSWLSAISGYQPVALNPTPYDDLTKDKRILVLGDQLGIYQNSRLATPYLNWSICKDYFSDPGYYGNLLQLHRNFNKDLPEVIIDSEQHMEEIFLYLPGLREKYSKRSQEVYVLK